MPRAKLPFNIRPYQNVDEVSLEEEGAELTNGILVPKPDGSFVSKRRPGFSSFITLGTGVKVDGLYWWDRKQLNIANSAGQTFKITDSVGTFLDITTDVIPAGVRTIYAEHGDNLFMTSGGRIAFTNGVSNTAFIASAAAPVGCTHVQFIDQYLVAINANDDKLFFSDVGDPFTWQSLSFISAQSSFDITQAILVKNRNIIIFGSQTIEFWFNDGSTPFRRRNDINISMGTLSKYSVTDTDIGVFFMNENREVYLLGTNGSLKKVSFRFDKVLQELTNVTDALGDDHVINGKGFYVLHFPTDGRTFAYDYQNDYWVPWAFFSGGSFSQYLGNNYSYAAGFNLDLAGSFTDDKIYKLSFGTFDDDGTDMRWVLKTGHISHNDIISRKRSDKLYFVIKSGHSLPAAAMPNMMIRQRTDNRFFGFLRNIPLQKVGDTLFLPKMHRQGIYNTRQYELSISDAIDIEFVEAQESYTLLE